MKIYKIPIRSNGCYAKLNISKKLKYLYHLHTVGIREIHEFFF